ncbi:PAS domain S-box protein [Paracraurococcus ruber]|uniref:PAS domain S-box protein n=3 Tax=Paracraurococcus ruber TaxID=77675 RepID=UPI00130526CB|nr:PAS domain S-box protein [Paracraurococcus ruber]
MLLPLALGSAAATVIALRAYRQGFEQTLQHTAHAMALAMDAEIERSRAAAELLAAAVVRLDDGDEALVELHSRSQLLGTRLGTRFRLRGPAPDRALRFDSDLPLGQTPAIPPPAAFRPAVETAEAIGQSVLSTVDTVSEADPAVHLAVPLRREGVALGSIGAVLSAAGLSRKLAEHRVPDGVIVALVDAEGRIVARSTDAGRFVGRSVPDRYLLSIADREGGIYSGTNLAGQPSILAFQRLPRTPSWTVVASTTEAASRAAWQRPLTYLLAGSALALLLAILGARLMASRLIRPLATLAARARDVARGETADLERTAEPLPIAEFESLRRSVEWAASMLRRQADLAEEEGALLRSVLDATSDAVFVKDLDGRYVLVNGAAATVLDRPGDSVLGLTDTELWPMVAERLTAEDRAVLNGKVTSTTEEFLPVAASGTPRIFQTTRAPWRELGSGRVLGIVGIRHDVTEVMRTKQRLRLALEAADLGTWSWEVGPDGGSLEWDNRCRALHGLSAEAAANREVWPALLWSEDQPLVRSTISRALDPAETRDEICCTYRVDAPDGRARWLRIVGRAFFEPDPRVPTGRLPVRMMGTVQDVTVAQEVEAERMRAAAALAESEARFRDTFDQAAVGIAHVGLDGSWLRVNGRLCAMLGYSEAELLALSFQDITHPDDLDADLDNVRQVLGGEIASYNMEKRYSRKDGAVLWIELTVSLCRDADGSPLHFISVVQDIAGRKAAETARWQSEARLRLATTGTGIGTWELDLLAGRGQWSPEAAALLGIDHLDDTGESWAESIHPADRAGVAEAWRRAVENEAPYDATFRAAMPAPGGSERWLISRARIERDPTGRPLRGLGVLIDLTASKQAEAQLRLSEARFRALVEASAEVVWTCNVEGCTREPSPSWCAFTGQTHEEWLGWGWQDAIHPEDRDRVVDRWRACMTQGTDYAYEYRLRHRDGGYRWTEARACRLLDADGQLRGWVGMNADITARRLAEADRLASEARRHEAERTLQHMARRVTIAAMASGIAHELNQPLGAASNYLGTAVRLFGDAEGPPLDPAGRARMTRMLDRAGSQILRAGSVLQRLRDFLSSREPQRAVEPVAEVVREAVEMVLLGTPEAGLQTPVIVTDPATGLAMLDRVQIQQVVINLVRNAIEAMRDQPGRHEQRLTVSVGMNASGQAEVSVTDTGPGMPPESAARLFEAFHSSKPGGMGVGLSICRAIVEAHGGRITARTAPDGGMIFAFTLPRLADGEVAAEPVEMSA